MINRRRFLQYSAAGIAAGALKLPLDAQDNRTMGATRPAWPGPIGLQLYTVRNEFAKDPLATLSEIASVGYNLVEVDPFLFKVSPADLRNYLGQTGLRTVSGLFWMPGSPAEWEKQIDLARQTGLKYMVCMFVQRATADQWKKMAETLNRAGRQCRAHGIQLCYHNHITEFIPVGNTTGYEIFQTETDPHLVQFEMDVFWMVYAKQDPVAWFRRAPGRYPLLHIKDIVKQLPPSYNPEEFPQKGVIPFTEVGQGAIDWVHIFENVKLAGAKYIYVEQDYSHLAPLETIRMSYNYLRHLRIPA